MEALDEMMFIPYKDSIPQPTKKSSWWWILAAIGLALVCSWFLSRLPAAAKVDIPALQEVKLLSYEKLPSSIVLDPKSFHSPKERATAAAKDVKHALEKFAVEPAVIAKVVGVTVQEILSSSLQLQPAAPSVQTLPVKSIPLPARTSGTFSVKGLEYPYEEEEDVEEKDEKPQKINAESNQKILAMMKARGLSS